ncbi:MAG: hypothetical protein JST28_04090 [Acidobacteria bacterium]|nr:hypothetical protein [Acidobacteriota bacterium]
MRKVLRGGLGTRPKWLPASGLLLLCLIWAMGWVRADLAPGSAPGLKVNPLWNEAALLGTFAVLAGVAGAILKKRWPTGNELRKALAVGVGLFVAPAVLNPFIKDQSEDTTRVALFSLTPLFAVIFERHLRRFDESHEIRGGFLAAMVAVAGTFLVFPVELPHSYASAFAMLAVIISAAVVAATNCLGVEIVQRHDVCPLTLGAVSAVSASLLLGVAGLFQVLSGTSFMPIDAWAVSNLLALALLFWLMQRMNALQMTTRFLIAPLLANLMSLALLQPHVGFQSWIGLLLIAVGSGWMLFAPVEISDSPLTLNTRS